MSGRQLIIAVGREFGSGGREIAHKLAEHYNIPVYDKNLLKEVLDEKNVYIRYNDINGNKIHWKQIIVETGMITSTDSEYDDVIEKEYAGDNVKLYVYDSGRKRIYYERGNCTFILSVDDISVEDMYEMIKNMKKIEKWGYCVSY